MIQSDQVYVPDAADRAGAPTMGISGSYEKKGGARVVSILRDTRLEFASGKEHLEKSEAQQVKDFEASTVAYQKSRADLVDAGNRLSAELQSAELALTQQQGDLKANEDKVMQATTYLAQVGGSCNVHRQFPYTNQDARRREREHPQGDWYLAKRRVGGSQLGSGLLAAEPARKVPTSFQSVDELCSRQGNPLQCWRSRKCTLVRI